MTKDLRQTYVAILSGVVSCLMAIQTPIPKPSISRMSRRALVFRRGANRRIYWASLDRGGRSFDTVIQDIRRQATTHDVPATTKSAIKKKMTKDLHQTYAAIFLSLMSMFQATQTAAPTPTL
jgi:hypothetical protein